MASDAPIQQESLFTPEYKLHLRRVWRDAEGPPVLLVHGAIENGRIFYTESGKGLAPYLASRGFDVYVADLRGRGESLPRIGPGDKHGQLEAIAEDLPAFSDRIRELRGDVPQLWGAHSWGGVLLISALVRKPTLAPRVKGLVFFGTKRSVRAFNAEIALKIHLGWNFAARLLVRKYGYLPAKRLGFGSDDETELSHLHSTRWVKPGPWVDPADGFDYGARLKQSVLPPALFLAGQADRCLGNPSDVRDLILEAGYGERSRFELRILGRGFGYQHDYGHIDMLTHGDAPRDHFPGVADWMESTFGETIT